jgi:hypothetical protein
MTEQSDRPEPEQGPIGQLVRLFLTQLMAVVAIAAVITAVVSWTGAGLDDDVTAAPAEATKSASPRPDSSSAPATTSSAPATPAPSSTSAAPTTSSPESALPRVDVLNQSAPGGSASQLADQLRRRGWQIGRVDDFRGNVSETTVYYPPGLRAEARRLRDDLPGPPRLQPAFSTLKAGRLSVILVD